MSSETEVASPVLQSFKVLYNTDRIVIGHRIKHTQSQFQIMVSLENVSNEYIDSLCVYIQNASFADENMGYLSPLPLIESTHGTQPKLYTIKSLCAKSGCTTHFRVKDTIKHIKFKIVSKIVRTPWMNITFPTTQHFICQSLTSSVDDAFTNDLIDSQSLSYGSLAMGYAQSSFDSFDSLESAMAYECVINDKIASMSEVRNNACAKAKNKKKAPMFSRLKRTLKAIQSKKSKKFDDFEVYF